MAPHRCGGNGRGGEDAQTGCDLPQPLPFKGLLSCPSCPDSALGNRAKERLPPYFPGLAVLAIVASSWKSQSPSEDYHFFNHQFNDGVILVWWETLSCHSIRFSSDLPEAFFPHLLSGLFFSHWHGLFVFFMLLFPSGCSVTLLSIFLYFHFSLCFSSFGIFASLHTLLMFPLCLLSPSCSVLFHLFLIDHLCLLSNLFQDF